MIKSEKFEAMKDSSDVLSFRASNVTGTRELPIEVRNNLRVGDVTESIADLMALPDDVSWSLRADRGQFLDEDATIGDQLEPGSHVVITPRTHLG
jgi:hypothetical protein